MPKVSVVIPAYNCEKYFPEAIESSLNQSFQNFEIIAIDDCSTDGTWNVIQNYAKKDGRVRAYKNEKNLGIAGNRNLGVSLATGKYLAWQDADDISLPTRLEKQVRYLETHPKVGIVGGFIELFRDNKVIGVRKYAEVDSELRECIFRYSPVAQPSAMIRMEVFQKVGNYNLKYPPAEDLDMTFRIGEQYELANVQDLVIKYRESDSSATHTRMKKVELSTLEIRWKNSRSPYYKMSVIDYFYNLAHFLSIWMIPAKMKIKIFNYFRNKGTV
jgi:glycosyltransferase involved in cell wall biosynthesis